MNFPSVRWSDHNGTRAALKAGSDNGEAPYSRSESVCALKIIHEVDVIGADQQTPIANNSMRIIEIKSRKVVAGRKTIHSPLPLRPVRAKMA